MADGQYVASSLDHNMDDNTDGTLARILPQGFWANQLEFDSVRAERELAEGDVLDTWIDGLSGRRARMLCILHGLADEGPVGKLRPLLHKHADDLSPYYIVAKFGKGKAEVAALEVARETLSPHLVDLCVRPRRNPPEPDEPTELRYDKTALLFALYAEDPDLLREVFHFDKIHRKGFASMVLAAAPKPAEKPFGEFLTHALVRRILEAYHNSRRDGGTSELQGIWEREGRFFVFIRHTERPDHIHDGRHIVHGYRAEWIVLDFGPDGDHVNIASTTVDEPREIADRIASVYFGCDCRFVNEEVNTAAETIHDFIASARADDNCVGLVESCVSNSPLRGASKIRLSNASRQSFAESLDHLEQTVGPFLESLPDIDSVKVLYGRKRVGLQFDPEEHSDEHFVVRYTDQRLNGFERRRFEQLMRREHDIAILSTEKR